MTNRPPDGTAAASGPPYSETLVKPIVTIGNIPATVIYSGLVPGYPGLYQVNVQVPANATGGSFIAVSLTIGNTSDTGYMAVQ